MRFLALALILGSLTLGVGCRTGVSDSDQARMQKEFSQDNWEKNMKAMGKEAELAEAKRKADEYARAGSSGGQAQVEPDGRN